MDAKTALWIQDLVKRAGGDREKVVRWLQSIGLRVSRKDLRALIALAVDRRDNPERRSHEAGASEITHVEKVLARLKASVIDNESRSRELVDRIAREQREERAAKRKREKETPEGRSTRKRKAKMFRDARRDERKRNNPSHTVSQAEVNDAVGMFEEFTGERAGKAELLQVPEPSKTTIVLGELASISYVTSKQGGGKMEWVHRFKRPRPKLLADPAGKALFIAGGNFKIDDRGIVG